MQNKQVVCEIKTHSLYVDIYYWGGGEEVSIRSKK